MMESKSNYEKWEDIKNTILSTYNAKILGRSLFSVNGECVYIYTRNDISVNTLNSIISEIRTYKNFKLPLNIIIDNDKKNRWKM